MSTIGMLDIPGLFFTNPYTHIVEGPAAYLGILGAIVVGLTGLMGLWAYQFQKDSEVMQFTFGAFNLRARKNVRVPFHALLGTIERVPENLAEELKALLDKKIEELSQLAKVKPIETTAKHVNPDEPSYQPPEQQMIQPGTGVMVPTDPTGKRKHDLNLFFIPTPGISIPGVLLLSYAQVPEQLINPLPGEWIWEGWIRHAKGEVFDLGVCGEWQFKLPGQPFTNTVPICAAAGTYYDFTWGLERALAPPLIDQRAIMLAKQNGAARIVGLEAVKTLEIYRDAAETQEALMPTFRDQVTEMVGGILEVLSLTNQFTPPSTKKKTRYGLFVGIVFVASAVSLVGWLAIHGWHL
jgi:hypothetical protein